MNNYFPYKVPDDAIKVSVNNPITLELTFDKEIRYGEKRYTVHPEDLVVIIDAPTVGRYPVPVQYIDQVDEDKAKVTLFFTPQLLGKHIVFVTLNYGANSEYDQCIGEFWATPPHEATESSFVKDNLTLHLGLYRMVPPLPLPMEVKFVNDGTNEPKGEVIWDEACQKYVLKLTNVAHT